MCIYARTALAIVLLLCFISVCKSNGINNNRKPWYKSPAHIKIEKAMFGKVAEEQEKQRYTKNDEQKLEAEKIFSETNKIFNGKIQTNISKVKNYCRAEEYHQKYIEKNSR